MWAEGELASRTLRTNDPKINSAVSPPKWLCTSSTKVLGYEEAHATRDLSASTFGHYLVQDVDDDMGRAAAVVSETNLFACGEATASFNDLMMDLTVTSSVSRAPNPKFYALVAAVLLGHCFLVFS